MSDWKEGYRLQYARLKEAGRPFFPYTVFKDVVVVSVISVVLFYLSFYFGAPLEDLADPTDKNYVPRPEWYFLFLFQALKLFPGNLEALGAIILPGLAVLFLFLLPFIDRGPERHPLDRPLYSLLGLGAMAGWGWLTWASFDSPLANPAEEKSPLVSQGQRLYRELKCSYCHRVEGKGGMVGPELDKGAGGRSEEWLARHLRDPRSISPKTSMPKMNLLDDEIVALVAYLKTMEGEPFTEAAPKLFAEHCASCHRVGKIGEDSGPDLTLIGSARDKAFIKRYILDPSKSNPDSSMPGFQGQLTEVEFEDLARYLSVQGR